MMLFLGGITVAKQAGDKFVIDKVRTSDPQNSVDGRIAAPSDLSVGPLLVLLPERYKERLLRGLDADIVKDVNSIESISSDDRICDVTMFCGEQDQQLAVMDVLLSLKSGDVINAKNRIDLFARHATPVVNLQPQQVAKIQSSGNPPIISTTA